MNFDEIEINWDEDKQQEREQALTKLKRLLVDHPDISRLSVTYDGYGDEGCFNDMKCYDSFGNNVEATILRDALEDYIFSILPEGWDNNLGSFGVVEYNPTTGKSKVVHTWRVENEVTTEFEI